MNNNDNNVVPEANAADEIVMTPSGPMKRSELEAMQKAEAEKSVSQPTVGADLEKTQILEATPTVEPQVVEQPVMEPAMPEVQVEEQPIMEPAMPEVQIEEQPVMEPAMPEVQIEEQPVMEPAMPEVQIEEQPVMEPAMPEVQIEEQPVMEPAMPEVQIEEQPVMEPAMPEVQIEEQPLMEPAMPEVQIEEQPVMEPAMPEVQVEEQPVMEPAMPEVSVETPLTFDSASTVYDSNSMGETTFENTPLVEPMMDNNPGPKKSKKGPLKVIIVLILIAALIGGGYYLYTIGTFDSIINTITNTNSDSEKPKEEDKHADKDIDEDGEEIETLKIISIDHYLTEENSESIKIFYGADLLNIQDLANNYKTELVITYLEETNQYEIVDYNGFEYNLFAQEDIDAAEISLFGSSIDYFESTTRCVYSAEQNGYLCSEAYDGFDHTDKMFVSASRTTMNNVTTIDIVETVAFVKEDISSGLVIYYKDINMTEEVGRTTNDDEDYLAANQDMFNKYKHTFILNENEEYVYTSVELVK